MENPWTMRIFGVTDKIYYFHSPVYIDKFSSISFDIESYETPSSCSFCIYENETEFKSNSTLVEDEERCTNLIFEENGTSKVSITLGRLFGYRKTEIKYLRIVQDKGNNIHFLTSSSKSEVLISNLKIERDGQTEFSNVECNLYDSHSAPVEDFSMNKCVCDDGYISSNGGKVIGGLDKCVSNIPIGSNGLYDQSPCSHFRECASGHCKNGTCTEAGELIVQYNVFREMGAIQAKAVPVKSQGDSGLILGPDNKLNLFGDVHSIHRLSQPIMVNKFTELRMAVDKGEDVISTEICLLPDQDIDILKCKMLCTVITVDKGLSTINVAKIFADATIDVKFIVLMQKIRPGNDSSFTRTGKSTKISALQFVDRNIENILNDRGQCNDPNARRLRNKNRNGEDFCMCYDGYITSRGKMRGPYDTCKKCLDTSGSSNCYFTESREACAEVISFFWILDIYFLLLIFCSIL